MLRSRFDTSVWIIICASSLMLLFAFGFRASFGLFVQPMADSHGWGRDVIAMALAIQNLAWGVLAVFAGGLADRYGNIRVLLAGIVCYALGIGWSASVDSPMTLQLGLGVLVGAGLAGTGFGIILPLMANAVSLEQRQWVLGVGTAAGSLGQFLIVPLAQTLIDALGWREALLVLSAMAASMVILVMPIALLLKPRLTAVATAATEALSDVEHSLATTIRRARSHASYWLLTLGFFVCGFHLAFITVHFPGYLADNGFDPKVAAWSIAIIGLCNVFGALISGSVSSRLSMKRVLIFIYAMRALVTLALITLPLSLTSVLIFSCLTGFLWLATVPPTTGLVATMFGTRYMATLYGVVFLGHQVGSFTGVWLGGFLFERTGNYEAIWWTSICLSLIATLLHWPIQESSVLNPQPQG